jgi:hypothetical protein
MFTLVGVSTYNEGKSETTNTSFYILDTVHPNEKNEGKYIHMTVTNNERGIQTLVGNNFEMLATIITGSNRLEKLLSHYLVRSTVHTRQPTNRLVYLMHTDVKMHC